MRHQHGRKARFNCLPEGPKLLLGKMQDRQFIVGIYRSIAMAGKMLSHRHESSLFKFLHGNARELPDGARVISKTPHADNRVVPVEIHVQRWEKIKRKAQLSK